MTLCFIVTVLKHRVKIFCGKNILPCPSGQGLLNFKYNLALAVNKNNYKQAHCVSCVISNSPENGSGSEGTHQQGDRFIASQMAC